ncbi:phage tail protein [Sphingomonas sp. Leaf33]|uniref:phage tail protein n=1 Tax=Sphingomonas sp. Leaf33 TaxID=1736215 RepID=UPI0007004E59|nr:phage tail protein [Sphingomonas sp. Leaf33]KQN26638.1 phage tail protein [Sphingomonas sp. Leaf33]
MATNLTHPYLNLYFRVEISGIQIAAFQQVTLPAPTVGTVGYREGTDPPYVRQVSGLTSYQNLSLIKGVTDGTELADWFQLVVDRGATAPGAKKNISLIVIDQLGADKARWDVINAWPITYQLGSFDATSEAVLVETLTLSLDYMKRVR